MGVFPESVQTQITDLHFLTYKTTLEFIHYLYGEIEQLVEQTAFDANEIETIINNLRSSYETLEDLLIRSDTVSSRVMPAIRSEDDDAIIEHLQLGKEYLESVSFSCLGLNAQRKYLLGELDELRAFLKKRIELLNYNI